MTNHKGTFAIQSSASPMPTPIPSCAVSSISNNSAKRIDGQRQNFTQSAIMENQKKLSVHENQNSKMSLKLVETSPPLIYKSPAIAKIKVNESISSASL